MKKGLNRSRLIPGIFVVNLNDPPPTLFIRTCSTQTLYRSKFPLMRSSPTSGAALSCRSIGTWSIFISEFKQRSTGGTIILYEFRIGGLRYGDVEILSEDATDDDPRVFDQKEVRLLDFEQGSVLQLPL